MIKQMRYWLIEKLAGWDISVLMNCELKDNKVILKEDNLVTHNVAHGNTMMSVPAVRLK